MIALLAATQHDSVAEAIEFLGILAFGAWVFWLMVRG